MSAPIIYIIFPMIVSIALMGFLSRPKVVRIVGLITGGLLVVFALFQPIGNVLKLGPISFDIVPELGFFGRAFLLENSDRFTLLLIFATLTLFIGGAGFIGQPIKFIPLVIAIAAVLTAALSVEPFLYSAVLVELAVLLMIPLVMVKGNYPEKGVIRFLIYLSLAMPFILFAGWILGGAQANPSDETMRSMAVLFLSIGFALWLAVFPFHSWVPQFSEAINPYVASFIFCLLPVVTLLTMINFASSLVWLREAGYISIVLRVVGIIMIVTSGVWAAVEKNVKRILAFSVLYETGFALLLISQQSSEGISLLYQSFVPRIVALAIMGLSLAVIWGTTRNFTIQGLSAMVRRYPFAIVGILISMFTVIGFPLSAGFPIKFETLQLIGSNGAESIIWIAVGVTGFLIATIRIFSYATLPTNGKWEIHESAGQIVVIVIGSLVLLIIGLFPQITDILIGDLLINLPVLK